MSDHKHKPSVANYNYRQPFVTVSQVTSRDSKIVCVFLVSQLIGNYFFLL
jgi:hypothetical protein